MPRARTVGELKEYIKDLPDDTPIISYQSDMEKSGYQSISYASTQKMVTEKRETYDAFDYTPYSYTVFSPSKDDTGTLCLVIG